MLMIVSRECEVLGKDGGFGGQRCRFEANLLKKLTTLQLTRSRQTFIRSHIHSFTHSYVHTTLNRYSHRAVFWLQHVTFSPNMKV
jgi:hypothetical protein